MNHQKVVDPVLTSWQPPAYAVDEAGKVSSARPGEPNNWGRWGADDQLGCANLLTDDAVLAGVRAVRTGRRFSLALPVGPPATGAVPSPMLFRTASLGDAVLSPVPGRPAYADDVLVMGTQSSTQLDGLAHIAHEHAMYNGFWAGLVTAGAGAQRLGVHHLAAGVVGRGVLVDVARHLDLDVLPPSMAIGPDLLDDVLDATATTVGPGDVLLIRTGVLSAWDGRHGTLGLAPQAGLAATTAPWLAARDVVLVGADNSAVEAFDASSGSWDVPLHRAALRDLGLPLMELLHLDELAAACADDSRWDFLFVAAPLPLVGGVGSPINPLAIR